MENIWKCHYPKYSEKVCMPSLHQVLISMSVHPGTPFFPNKLSSIGTKQQMPSLSSPFLPPLFLIMSVCHTNNQAHALPLLLSHLRCLRKAWEWNCTSRISFVSGATRRAFPICSVAPVLQKHHDVWYPPGCLPPNLGINHCVVTGCRRKKNPNPKRTCT